MNFIWVDKEEGLSFIVLRVTNVTLIGDTVLTQ